MKATNVLVNLPKGVKGVVNFDLHIDGKWVKEINPGSMTARQMVKAAAKTAKETNGERVQVFMYFDCLCIGEVVCTGAGAEVRIYSNEPTEETTDNTPNVADLARWIDLQLSTIIDGVSAGYTLGNYNSVWIDKGSTVFNVSLANGETVEIDSDNYNTAEEIATAIISTLKNTPATMNADETTTAPEFSELSHAATNIVLAAENTQSIYAAHVEPLLRSLERKVSKGITLSLDTLAKSSAMAVIIRESIKEVKRTSYDPFSANKDDRRAAALYLANIYIGEK